LAEDMRIPRVVVVIGTRPEAIKMAPVIAALRKRSGGLKTSVWSTGQHRSMLDQVLSLFGIRPDVDFNVMAEKQALGDLTAKVLGRMNLALTDENPDMVLVQGDTTTVFATALACFYRRVPVAHIEAGLRTHRKDNPFPEEINRRITAPLADISFAPTALARDNLIYEGVPED